ncbi:hypothetical protein AJ80_03123 [Polytolypa hystricis UAMH7299]|uniref:HRDC domain-containing protein n=1 Tax=Polytolypa hystricis (strain UAMH7299) TaxID=1447883 RepID=A0A2B7YKM1_POLH7|nr:hypothetical protein AJ80_03123 [Polytolypa hystricis UAMH7299]
MDLATDFAPFQERVFAALLRSTRTASQISSEDLSFQRSLNPTLYKTLDLQSVRLLELANSILKISTSSTDLETPDLQNEETIDEKWRAVVDVVDQLLEKADASLDEFTGVIKKLSPSQQERGASLSKTTNSAQFPSVYNFGPSKIPKPQLQFKRAPDNANTASFKPLLQSKPHAVVPLTSSPASNGDAAQSHPYEVEISSSKYPPSVYRESPPQQYLPFESTTATFVDTLDGVHTMLAELKQAKEIAVDLEHHDAHSYQGIVCLMQISTREKDWIVDTLKPWREELRVLNEVFADPNILKVLHGSTMDIIWLQRDLGLYVVGLFDTFHASVALQYQKKSLKFLLEKFVNFRAEKQYQMADWRLRPLLPGMFDYARSDTHYLLYIYDHVRNDLLTNSNPNENLIDYVLLRSKEEALQRYERPTYNALTGEGPGGWYDALLKSSALFSKEQFAVFRAVHQWRDQIARSEDEGVQYVLSKQSLFRIANSMPLDQPSLLKAASPVSPIVRIRASELVQVIKEAKIAGATGPEMRDILRPKQTAIETPVTPEEPPVTTDSAMVAKAEVSQFWGSTLQNTEIPVPSSHALLASTEASLLSLPLPTTSIKVSDTSTLLVKKAPVKLATPVQAPSPKPTPSNEIFTVKQFGAPKKRKVTPTQAAIPAGATSEDENDGTSSDEATSSSSSSSSESEEEKPPVKKRKTALGDKKASARNTDSDSTPFDYAAAESVLHPKRTDIKGPYPSRSQPHFNPYTKSLNAPSGARKPKKAPDGKSFTFRR